MNWKLIFQLSSFGLIMAFATVSLIPEHIEPFFWLGIFVICAYIIAKNSGGKYFLHGFLVSLVNCIWITGVHVAFYKSYVAHHPDMLKMAEEHPIIPSHPRLGMLIVGPFFGVAFGLILGFFSFIASKMVSKKIAMQ
jgi:uncharacterized membrane protein